MSISDRASSGVYQDEGIPALQTWFGKALSSPWYMESRLMPDEKELISKAIVELVDEVGCDLVLTTGGTSPSRRNARDDFSHRNKGKTCQSLLNKCVKSALNLFLQLFCLAKVATPREISDHAALIINLPWRPKAIQETLGGLKDADGKSIVPGIFAAGTLLHRFDWQSIR